MKRLLLLYTFIASIVAVQAQSVDVTKVTADTKTYLFNDGKNTVKNYIYDRLQAQTSCSGSDRIYLEVKVDPSGYVLSAKALTGKNDCFKEAVVDIVKNIKWDASDFKGPKSIFFEVKPEIAATEGRKNEYVKIPTFNNPMINPTTGLPVDYAANQVQPQPTAPATSPANADPKQPSTPQPVTPTPAPTQPVAVVTPPTPAPTQPVVTPTPTPVPATAPVVAATQPRIPVTPGNVPSIGSNPVAVTPPTTSPAPAKMPVPQAPVKAGPTPEDIAKARETADEVAALRAEMDKRMKDEENKNKAATKADLFASAEKGGDNKDAAGDKKEGMKDDGGWTIDEKSGKKTEKKCTPVLNKDGKPLVDKNGKPVLECKTVVVEDKTTEPKETAEQIAARKKADEEAAKKAAEDARLAKMTPEERKRADEDKRRMEEEKRLADIEKAANDAVVAAERKVRDNEAAQRKIQDDMKRQETEMKRAQEDLERAKTEAQRKKDEVEVTRIEAEKRSLDEKKKEQERALQEKMREMQKMQSDVERLTGDLQKQQEELRKAEEKLTQTKQNIATRANGGVVINTDAPAMTMPKNSEPKKTEKVETTSGDTAATNQLMMQIDLLRQQIYRMQQEMDAARSMNSAYGRPVTAPTTSTVYSKGTSAAVNTDWSTINNTQPAAMPVPTAPGATTNGPRNAVESQSAASNRAWESIDYNNTEPLSKTSQGRDVIMNDMKAGKPLDSKAQRAAEKATPATTPAPTKAAPAPAPQPKVQVTSAPVAATPATTVVTNPAAVPANSQAPVAYVSTGDKNPDASHVGTFTNVPVASNAQLEFIDGDQGMKNYLRDKLKAQGVCGLAHVISEVNVDRNGNVTSYKVLKSVPEDLVTKVPSVILGMKFKTNPATAPYTQTTYIEFKGDIRCEGKPASKVNIKNEEDFLKTDKK